MDIALRYPFVIPNAIAIPEALSIALDDQFDKHRTGLRYAMSISDGPIGTDMHHSLFLHEGSIDEHDDDGGITYSLVLLAEGKQHLRVGSRQLPLETGTFFAINSDALHATKTKNGNYLSFIVRDFGHVRGTGDAVLQPPTIPICAFIRDSLDLAHRVADIQSTHWREALPSRASTVSELRKAA